MQSVTCTLHRPTFAFWQFCIAESSAAARVPRDAEVACFVAKDNAGRIFGINYRCRLRRNAFHPIEPSHYNDDAPAKVAVENSCIMEANMNLRASMVLVLVGFVAQPAFAQPAPTTVRATIDRLLDAGYEIKAVNITSDAATKEVFPSQATIPSQSFVTLQKGTPVAVCEVNTVDRLSLKDAIVSTDATRCRKR